MSRYRQVGEAPPSSQGNNLSPEASPADLASLLNYPSLGRLFEGSDTQALEDMRARLARTNEDLERVVRQGTKDEAERAARASRAVGVTLALLKELEQVRRAGDEPVTPKA